MKQSTLCVLIIFAGILSSASALRSIREFGAIPNNKSDEASWINSRAIAQALVSANSSEDDRVAHIPEGDTYYMFYFEAANLTNLTFRIDGTLFINDNRTAWPAQVPHRMSAFYFQDSSHITIEGKGVVEGQGYWWWWNTILTAKDHRASLLVMEACTDVVIRGVEFRNSPEYHIFLHDVRDVVIRDLSIMVDTIGQKKLLSDHGLLDSFGIPTFPLNTDGIDPAGENILIENVTIQCYDDAVAVKPMTKKGKNAQCSRNMTIRNATVIYGVGMTIGSVPPNDNFNCVEDILFEDILFRYPIKAIYVKPNPGDHGYGIINNITYRNIVGHYSLWYPIWIGTQQQQQPGDDKGTGCSFFYPIIDKCPTQPRVPISNLTLENVTFTGGLTLPGVIICNETAPCTGFKFINVKNTGVFLVQRSYVVKNIYGISVGSSPNPHFATNTSDSEAFEYVAENPTFDYVSNDGDSIDIADADDEFDSN